MCVVGVERFLIYFLFFKKNNTLIVFRSIILSIMLHLLLVLTVGQRVDVPWGGGGCETDWDCSLGGECYAPTPGQ